MWSGISGIWEWDYVPHCSGGSIRRYAGSVSTAIAGGGGHLCRMHGLEQEAATQILQTSQL
jgi:hypothetical protein